MPKRTDIKTILILGSGPIVIGQGCEFDYSGTQACKALRAEGFRVVLVNSNPATIMTDPEFSDRTYIEPITPAAVRKIIAEQRKIGDPIHAILPTLGGQTALNCACALFDNGTLKEFGVEMIGANREVIHRAEDRQIFKDIVEKLGLKMPRARTVKTLDEAREFLRQIGLPAIIRPAFTLGGSGGGIAYNAEEFDEIIQRGLRMSPITQVQIDQSVLGWKEYELEVVRDKKDNCIIVCGIENIDPMGIHTGDSITVAPILTLTDKEYQAMRDAAMAIMRAVGVETGGSNVQFAVDPNPKDGKFHMVVVEMNPRVSRSSALASKATGFPIAKIAAKLAIGYTLDELRNDITGTTSACFEPAIDYIVTKMPRWTFEKFPEADETLTTQMKSVGEAMAIGRTFCESLQKAIRSMEVKRFGLGLDRQDAWLEWKRATAGNGGTGGSGGAQSAASEIDWPIAEEKLSRKLAVPSQGRLYYIRYAMKMGWTSERIFGLSKIDPFFLDQIRRLVEFEDVLCRYRRLEDVPREVLFEAKQLGYSDAQLANLYLGKIGTETILAVRAHRKGLAIEPVYKLVDTCAAEFEAVTPYYYSTYERGIEASGHQGSKAQGHSVASSPALAASSDEVRVTDKKKVIILGGGPNRIGQGIEFDYCCVHASFAARELGFESVMINSNPETVSTDYDTSDLLFFEPLTLEDVLNVVERLSGAPLHPNGVPSPLLTKIKDLTSPFGPSRLTNDSLRHKPEDWLCSGLSEPQKTGECLLPTDLEAQLLQQAAHHGLSQLAIIGLGRTYFQENGTPQNEYIIEMLTKDGRVWSATFPTGSEPRLREFEHFEAEPHWKVAYDGFDVPHEQVINEWLAPAARTSIDPVNAPPLGLVHGLIIQFGGQTPLNLGHGLTAAGAPIIGTSVDSIDLAEDRDRFDALLNKLKLRKPPSGIARSLDQAVAIAQRIGYPVLVRPSYVLGGRGMEICSDEKSLRHYMTNAVDISELEGAPVLIDRFLDDATEVDVDVVADYATDGILASGHPGIKGHDATRLPALMPSSIVCGVMEHIEQAGIHSGDSACTIPPWSLKSETVEEIKRIARELARELRVRGLMNVQMAIQQGAGPKGEDQVFILEVNPRASRTVPFVGKAKHTPWARIAAKVMMGRSLAELGAAEAPDTGAHAVKESVFPFSKFPGVDVVLGPEMRSTGEVMGIDQDLAVAFAKAQLGAGVDLPVKGNVFISVRERDRKAIARIAQELVSLGFGIFSTSGTGASLQAQGIPCTILEKIGAGARPNVIDLMANGEIQLVINTPTKTGWQTDEGKIRAATVRLGVPMITTTTGAHAAALAIRALKQGDWGVRAMQDFRAAAGGGGSADHSAPVAVESRVKAGAHAKPGAPSRAGR